MQNDGFAPVGGETRSYLNEQKTGIIPSLRYGVGTMDENGCGMMAVYNSDDAWWGGPEIANSIDDYLNRTKRKAVASDKETEPYVGLSLHCISKKRR